MFRNAETMVFKKKEYEYRLANFEFTKAGKFKCTLTLSKGELIIFKDAISLDKHAHRKRFVDAGKDKELDADLIKIRRTYKNTNRKRRKG